MESQFNIDFSVQNNNYYYLPTDDILTISMHRNAELLFELGTRLMNHMMHLKIANNVIEIVDYCPGGSDGIELIRCSASLGHPTAIAYCIREGEFLTRGTLLSKRNMTITKISIAKAIEIYEHPLNATYPPAIFGLGYCYEKGIGVKQNKNYALKLYRKAISYNYHMAISMRADTLQHYNPIMSLIYRFSLRHVDPYAMIIAQSTRIFDTQFYILSQFLESSVANELINYWYKGKYIFNIENKPSAIDWFINQDDDDRNFILKQQKTHALIIEAIGMLPFPIAEEIIPHIIAYDNDDKIIKNNVC